MTEFEFSIASGDADSLLAVSGEALVMLVSSGGEFGVDACDECASSVMSSAALGTEDSAFSPEPCVASASPCDSFPLLSLVGVSAVAPSPSFDCSPSDAPTGGACSAAAGTAGCSAAGAGGGSTFVQTSLPLR